MSDDVIKIFRDWLNYGHAGCYFASHAASKAHLGYVVMADAPDRRELDALTAQIDELWATSKQATKLRLAQPAFSARWLYDVSFCLSRDAVAAALA